MPSDVVLPWQLLNPIFSDSTCVVLSPRNQFHTQTFTRNFLNNLIMGLCHINDKRRLHLWLRLRRCYGQDINNLPLDVVHELNNFFFDWLQRFYLLLNPLSFVRIDWLRASVLPTRIARHFTQTALEIHNSNWHFFKLPNSFLLIFLFHEHFHELLLWQLVTH